MSGLGLTLKLRVGRKGYIILPKAVREVLVLMKVMKLLLRLEMVLCSSLLGEV